ncbi:helix-turn-helix domain-containing protein [Nonomuraea sp. SYSU D8015]|uniref:AraC-like ligand-binding domain-containing protein n=1 Tax=Nonomuraea sp. SYSU D8015 TaxID=2593644 RepID=UPI0016609FE8|nr:helix-turn-helix domain-containing protein [Nonomuraea sp. SYSU D8015]
MLIFDTDTLPVADRLDAFHHALTDGLSPNDIVYERPASGVRAQLELSKIGTLSMFTVRSTGFEVHRTERHVRLQSSRPGISISLQDSGVGRSEVAGERLRLGAEDITVFHQLTPRMLGWSGSGVSRAIVVDADRLGMSVDEVQRAAFRLRASPMYDLVLQHLRGLWIDPDRMAADPGAPAVAHATVELMRALMVSALNDERSGATRSVMDETLLTRIKAYISANLTDPELTPERIAREHAVSLRQLYTVLSRGGLSLEQWIITQRLEGARAALASRSSDHLTIGAIARRWGFARVSHFNRRFREAYGVTPGEWRRLGRSA